MRIQQFLCLVAVQLTAVIITTTTARAQELNPVPCSKYDILGRHLIRKDLVYNKFDRMKVCSVSDIADIKSSLEDRVRSISEQAALSITQDDEQMLHGGFREPTIAEANERLLLRVNGLEAELALEHLRNYLYTKKNN